VIDAPQWEIGMKSRFWGLVALAAALVGCTGCLLGEALVDGVYGGVSDTVAGAISETVLGWLGAR
jgi:hypothetical protein